MILLIDDILFRHNCYKNFFKEKYSGAFTPDEGIDLLNDKKNVYNAIFLDYNFYSDLKSGYEIALEMRKSKNNLAAFIFLISSDTKSAKLMYNILKDDYKNIFIKSFGTFEDKLIKELGYEFF
jgi:hypothetical protein